MVATAASAALAALKNTPAPKFIRVKESDSEGLAQISVPEVKRWKGKVCKILESMSWAYVEPLDSRGNIIGPRIDNPDLGRAGGVEDLDLEAPSETNAQGIASLTGLVSLMLKAQDTALVRQRQAYADVLDNNQKLVGVVSDRLRQAERTAMQSFDVITALHNRLNLETLKGEGEEEEGIDGLVKNILGDVVKSKLAPGDGSGS